MNAVGVPATIALVIVVLNELDGERGAQLTVTVNDLLAIS